jgi:uncharacterized OB-fold protein
MIQCLKCQSENTPDREKCQECGADLLPGEGISDRLGNLVIGILAGVLSGIAAYVMIESDIELPDCLIISPQACMFTTIAAPIAGLVSAVRKTPLYKRYATRARRHIELDPEQAIADFSQALETAPEKERAGLLKERSTLYEKLGMEEEATRDELDYTSAEGAYAGGRGFARFFGADDDVYAKGMGEEDRKKMVAAGRVKALGYCSKCGRVVELNPKLRCPDHKSPKPKAVKFVLPDAVEAAIPEVLNEYTKERRTRRNVIIIVALVLSVPLSCCLFSIAMQNLTKARSTATATASRFPIVPSPSPTQKPLSTPVPKIVLPSPTSVAGVYFTDASIMSTGWLEDGSLLVTLHVPEGVEGNYRAVVGGNEFTCEILENYPDRLYCHGTGVKSGVQVEASWYLEGIELPVYETIFIVP